MWYRGGRCLGRERSRSGGRGDYVHLAPNEIGCKCRQAIILPFRPAIFDRHVAAFDVTGFA